MSQVRCETCGFSTDEPLHIGYHGATHDFCCFECAI
jgi:hypothetical protein